jgi:hypothetical protein
VVAVSLRTFCEGKGAGFFYSYLDLSLKVAGTEERVLA